MLESSEEEEKDFGFRFRVSRLARPAYRVSVQGRGSVFRVPSSGSRVPVSRLRVSGFGVRPRRRPRDPGSGFRAPDFGAEVSGFGFRVLGFGGVDRDGDRVFLEVPAAPAARPAVRFHHESLFHVSRFRFEVL